MPNHSTSVCRFYSQSCILLLLSIRERRNHAPSPLEVSELDRAVLERRTRSKTASQRDVTRARVVLMAADGKSNNAIAEAVGIDTRYVGMWRKRNRAQGLDGLKDRPRPGRPAHLRT